MTIAHFHRLRPARLIGITLTVGLLVSVASVAQASAGNQVATELAAPQGTGGATTLLLSGLDAPVFVTNAGDDRLFIVQRGGKIVIAQQISGNWQITGTFLNITGIVNQNGGEQGLLGLAFPHNYAASGLFYVYYVNNNGDEVVAEYHRASQSSADPNSRRRLLVIKDPYDNHNGGWMAFRPGEPYLYVATGDGGSGGDPQGRAQNIHVLLGKILRIGPRDPDGAGPRRYAIPPSNPFVGRDGKDAIFAFGLRNPWRNSFDSLNGDLWVGDVGQNKFEEIDHVTSGLGANFGWNKLEGRHRYPGGGLCTSKCHKLPVIEYRHSVSGADNCSVTGGYVSRRPGAPLYGRYFFADFCSGRMWHVPASFSGGPLPAPTMTGLSISSFGEGDDRRIYAVDLGGSLYSVAGT